MHLGAAVLLLLHLCVCVQLKWVAAGAGANFRTSVGSESAEDLVQLLRTRGIGRIRLHDADSAVLRAIAAGSRGAPIDVIVGVKNDEIVDMGVSLASAQTWIARNVVSYLPGTNIVAIAVGSDVLTRKEPDPSNLVPFLVPAMTNLYAALSEVGLEKQIKVSAPQSAALLSTYFPPSSATFNGGVERVVGPLLDFLESSGSYFMLNLYPQDLQNDGAAAGDMVDAKIGQHYSRKIDVLTDAMASLGHSHKISVVGIEMGWSRTDRISGGVVVDIGSGFLEQDPRQKVKSLLSRAAFSSRRFLQEPVQEAKQADERRKRRSLVDKSWCVAKTGADTNALQNALDWACGPGKADCAPIQLGQSCYLPNNIVAHASYAFNSYYQMESWASGSCDFGGLAQTTTSDPSTASCLYSSSTTASGTPSTPTGTTVPTNSASTRLIWDRCGLFFTSFILMFLIRRTIPGFKV